MIRKTLQRTKAATYAILLPSPDPKHQGMPIARGTGFFVDSAGYFLTALHVVHGQDVTKAWLQQSHAAGQFTPMLQEPSLVQEWPECDLAMLSVDFERNADKAHLEDRDDFPFIPVDLAPQDEGAPVYAFGYPLPQNMPPQPLDGGGGLVGHTGLGPRTTSAIISSTLERTRMVQSAGDTQVYVLDKALNYGNSGGPIVNTESGSAFAVCSRFQPVRVPQPGGGAIMIPSLYGVVSSISNIAQDLEDRLSYL